MQATRFLVAISFVVLVPVELAACGSSDDAPTGAAPLADGGSSSGATSGGDAAADGAVPSDGILCDGATPVVRPMKDATGTLQATLVNNGANLDPAFSGGTMPCTAYFEPMAGYKLGGGALSGAFGIRCLVVKNDRAFELSLVDGMGRPVAKTYNIGVAATFPGDGDTTTWNGEMTLRLLEMPACVAGLGAKKVWGAAEKGTGTLVIDSVAGDKVTFHITASPLTTFKLPGEDNLSQGSLELTAMGQATMMGL